MRKTKIICTLGPATDREGVLENMIKAGMDVARVNFSHGSHEEHAKRLEKLVALRELLNLPIATMLDTRGPEVRTKCFKSGPVNLKKGQNFVLTTREVEGDENIVSVTYQGLPGDLKPGDTVLIDDGKVELRVLSTDATDIACAVQNDGPVGDHKGINLPGVSLRMPYMSEQDADDIEFGIRAGFDFIAASFVRSADDVLQIRKLLDKHRCKSIKIISKIENAEGVANIDDILRVSDGIMVARGDMGVEIPLEEIPVIQKMLIKKCYNAGKQVITATQMLDSMMQNPRPTRAEATDVANAIYDGTSAIMLSGETAAGNYPVEAVKTMARIACRAEEDIRYDNRFRARAISDKLNITDAISHAACTSAYDLEARAIIVVTNSGTTARMVSKYRSSIPVIGCSVTGTVCRQMNLSWGVTPLLLPECDDLDDLFELAVEAAKGAGLVRDGDLVVITAGTPLRQSGTTNLLKVHIVGDVLISGKGISDGKVVGNLCVCKDEDEALQKFKQDDILVIPETSPKILHLLKMASGIITEEKFDDCYTGIVGSALDIPVLIDAAGCTETLKSGTTVKLDATKGIVSSSTLESSLNREE